MPLDFSNYVPGIPNMGPKYVAPTVIQLIEGLQIQINTLKQLLGTFTDAEYEEFKTETEAALEDLSGDVGDITTALSGKEDKSNKTQVISSASTADEYPSAQAAYLAIDNVAMVLPYKEDKTNKTGTIDQDSTATQYPNAEAVYTELKKKADGYVANGAAKMTAAIPFGACDATSTSTAFTVTVPGITELKNGVSCMVKNGVITSAAGCTLNVNGLGAKPIYSSLAAATAVTTLFNINYTMLFIYDEDRVAGGCWVVYYGYDSNTNTIGYQLRTNSQRLKMTDKMYRYRLMFTGMAEDTLVPANSSTSTNATAARTPITTPINPHGPIYYYGYTTAIDAGSRPSATYYWQQYVVTLGYSFTASTLTAFKSLYLKCTPQADGSAVIDPTTPYTQALPTTNDGYIYIFLGVATTETAFELNLEHPVYYHDGTALRIWTGPTT